MIKTLLFLVLAFSIAGERQNGKIIGLGKGKINITLSNPNSGWTQDRMVLIEGNVSDTTVNPITISINGDRYYLKTNSGYFKRKFPVISGKNSISAIAKNQEGTYEASKTIFAEIPVVPIMVVLTSDTDGVYTDLHIYEPSASSRITDSPNVHVYWADTKSTSGGVFYLNEQDGSYDKPGYGPYLYTHKSPPLGIYRVDANYWPSGDKAHTQANLNVVLFGGTANEQRRIIKYPLVKSGQTKTLAWLKIEKNQVGYIYCPLTDSEPDKNIWPSFVQAEND